MGKRRPSVHRDGRAQTQERRLTKAKGGCLLLISTVPPGPIRSYSGRSPRSCSHLPIPRGYHLVQHCPNDLRITLAPIQPSVPQAGRYCNRHPVVEASHQVLAGIAATVASSDVVYGWGKYS